MIGPPDDEPAEAARSQRSWLRIDLLIAVCALLISSLGSAASWWQARLLNEQTRVLQQQLGAQVWPYVDVTEGINGETFSIHVENSGLGPAILRSETASVGGVLQPTIIAVLHALVGPNMFKRLPHGERWSLNLDGSSPGAVLRPGESTTLLSLRSKTFAGPLIRSSERIRFSVCYCAIIPGQCWLFDSSKTDDPQVLSACHALPTDLMHSSAAQELYETP